MKVEFPFVRYFPFLHPLIWDDAPEMRTVAIGLFSGIKDA